MLYAQIIEAVDFRCTTKIDLSRHAHLITNAGDIEGYFYGDVMRLGLFGFLRPTWDEAHIIRSRVNYSCNCQ